MAGHSWVQVRLSLWAESQEPPIRGGGCSEGVRPVRGTIRLDLGKYKEAKDMVLVLGMESPHRVRLDMDIRSSDCK